MIPKIPYEVEQLALYRSDPVKFFEDCVFTLDQADKLHPVKQYPAHFPYLRWLIMEIVNEYLLAAVKHRRLIVTWTGCGVLLWDAMFFEGRFNALVSKKEEDSDELVRRCKFIYDNIPEEKLPLHPKGSYKYTSFKFEEIDSEIKGVAQGPDQLRQYTCSRVMCDEMAFWPHCRQTFTGLKPTLEGGGKVFLASTRWPGFFRDIVEDTIDNELAV